MLVNNLLTLGVAGRRLHLKLLPPLLWMPTAEWNAFGLGVSPVATCEYHFFSILSYMVILLKPRNVIGITDPQNHKNSTTTIVRNIYHRSWMCKISNISTVTGICDRLISRIKAQQARCPLLCEMIIKRPPSEDICCTAIARSGCVGLECPAEKGSPQDPSPVNTAYHNDQCLMA